MTTRKEESLSKFRALEAVLEESPEAGTFLKTVASLKAKLAKEKEKYLSLFERSEERVMEPSMGLIEMTSEKSEQPEYFFGSPVKSRDSIRIRVYQASVNPQTEEIFPEELITDVVMTEKQFGDILSQPGRGTGFPVTQITRDGVDVPPYDPSFDPGKKDMKRLTDAIGGDHHFADMLQSARQDLLEAQEKGRMKKSDGQKMARHMMSLTNNIPSNAKYRVDRISEAYAGRVSESILTLHLDIRSEQVKLANKKDDES